MSLAYTSVTTANVAFGYGQHADTPSPERLVKVSLVNYIDFTLGIVSFSLPKLAALLNRIVNPNQWQKAALWILTRSVALTPGICIIVLFTMCDPPQALWDTSLVMQGATCRDVWILIYYAIFTGGKSFFFFFFGFQNLKETSTNVPSILRIYGSVPCDLPERCSFAA